MFPQLNEVMCAANRYGFAPGRDGNAIAIGGKW